MPCWISLSQLEQIVEQQEYYYNECIRVENYNTLIEQWNSALKSNDYSSAIKYFQTAKKYADSSTLSNLNNVIWWAYFSLWNQYFDKKDWLPSSYCLDDAWRMDSDPCKRVSKSFPIENSEFRHWCSQINNINNLGRTNIGMKDKKLKDSI